MRHPPFRKSMHAHHHPAAAAVAAAEVPIQPYYDITVRYADGTYRTSRVAGRCASCTSSPARAAERLAQKIYGAADLDSVKRIDSGQGLVSQWRITAPKSQEAES